MLNVYTRHATDDDDDDNDDDEHGFDDDNRILLAIYVRYVLDFLAEF